METGRVEITMEQMIAELTNDFVACFSDPKNKSGAMWHILGFTGMLPKGVDPTDARVVALLVEAQQNAGCTDQVQPAPQKETTDDLITPR